MANHLLDDLEPEEGQHTEPVIFSYSRAQAIADGVLVDVTETGPGKPVSSFTRP